MTDKNGICPTRAKARCQNCQREILQTTLDRNGGRYCLPCRMHFEKARINVAPPVPTAPATQYGRCACCQREQRLSTLERNGGLHCRYCVAAIQSGALKVCSCGKTSTKGDHCTECYTSKLEKELEQAQQTIEALKTDWSNIVVALASASSLLRKP